MATSLWSLACCTVLLLSQGSLAQLDSILRAAGLTRRQSAPSVPNPISIAPTGLFEGDDGNWSTFNFRIGSPRQPVRLIPSISGSGVFVVDPRGCPAGYLNNCTALRGGTYDYNASSTSWQANTNTIALSTSYGIGGNFQAVNVYDNATLDVVGGGKLDLDQSNVNTYASSSYWLGLIGLCPRNLNLSTPNNNYFLATLESHDQIPSVSFGFTGGAWYRNNGKGVVGSLIFGGSDAARYESANVVIPMDENNYLRANIQQMSVDIRGQSVASYDTTVNAILDNSVTSLYLPYDLCLYIERAFGLTWNNNRTIYLVNDTQHEYLTSRNPSVTFRMSAQTSGGSSVAITLPYSAFDVLATFPLARNGTTERIFPLRRQYDSSAYLLGRAFFQEAYITVDLERGNFTLAPAKWGSANQQDIRPILSTKRRAAVDQSASTSGTGTSTGGGGNTSSSKSLSAGAIAGIVIGALAALALVAGLIFFFLVRRRRSRKTKPFATAPQDDINEKYAGSTPDNRLHEADGSAAVASTPWSEGGKSELDAQQSPTVYHELDGNGTHDAYKGADPTVSPLRPDHDPRRL